MLRRTAILPVLGLGLALIGFASSARADFTTVPQTFTITSTQTDWDPNTLPKSSGPNPFVVQQFNHTKYDTVINGVQQTAKLTAVEMSLAYKFQNTITFTFVTPATIKVTADGTIKLYNPGPISDSNLALPAASFSNPQSLFVAPSPVGTLTHVPLATVSFSGTKSSPAGGYTDATTLNRYTGTGTVSLPTYAKAQSTFQTDSGNGFGSSLTNASATLTVIYRYALVPVPEPSSIALLGLGGIGLVAATGRKRGWGRPSTAV